MDAARERWQHRKHTNGALWMKIDAMTIYGSDRADADAIYFYKTLPLRDQHANVCGL